MPPHRVPERLDQYQRPLDVRDQTIALHPSFSPLTVGADCGSLLDSGLSPMDCYDLLGTALSPTDAAKVALRYVEQVFEKRPFLEFSDGWAAGVIAASPGPW